MIHKRIWAVFVKRVSVWRSVKANLSSARDQIRSLLQRPASFMRALFRDGEDQLDSYLRFRVDSISRIASEAADLARRAGLAVGLDCFSPVLTNAVAQDVAKLDGHCDWIKFMTYGHTLAPAGLPFELNGAKLARSSGSCERRAGEMPGRRHRH